jgi:hypothetical protein
MLRRCALLATARSLRQNILRGRICCNPSSDPGKKQEQERGQDVTPFGTACMRRPACLIFRSPVEMLRAALSAVERN